MLKINPASGEAEGITLFDLMDGAVKERAGLVLKQVLENIRDLNTDPCKARTLTVKFTFAADGDGWKRDAILMIRDWFVMELTDEQKQDVIILA